MLMGQQLQQLSLQQQVAFFQHQKEVAMAYHQQQLLVQQKQQQAAGVGFAALHGRFGNLAQMSAMATSMQPSGAVVNSSPFSNIASAHSPPAGLSGCIPAPSSLCWSLATW